MTVYFFRKYDIRSDENMRSKRPATLAAIAEAEGRPILESAIEIDASELDDDGFRRRDLPKI